MILHGTFAEKGEVKTWPLSQMDFADCVADPLILGGTSLGLLLVTLVANFLPARRAATLEPMVGL